MGYNTPAQVREACGLSEEEAPDAPLNRFILKGDRATLAYVSVVRMDEEVSGAIDGSNTVFKTARKPLADTNCDAQVDAYDIGVYVWSDKNDPTTRELLGTDDIESIYDRDGVIKLKEAPGLGGKLTVDYSYFPQPVNYAKVKDAAALMTGYFFILSEWLLVPDTYALGPLRFKQAYPWVLLRKEAMRIISEINTRIHRKGEGRYTNVPIRFPLVEDVQDIVRSPSGQSEEI